MATPDHSRVRAAGLLDETTLRLTALLLALHGSDDRSLQLGLLSFVAVAWVRPGLLGAPLAWGCLSALVIATHVGAAYTTDNHKILLGWWLLALAAHCVHPGRELLRRSARILIGLCFACAVAWKLGMPDYRDGSFFGHTLLFDSRFDGFLRLVSGVEGAFRTTNEAAREAAISTPRVAQAIESPPALAAIAHAMTWWTVFIEALLAIVFLTARDHGRRLACAHVALVTFIVSTYAVAPVVGFGWTLAVMGLASCRPVDHHWRRLYVACLVCMQVVQLPWRGWIHALSS